MYLHAGQLEISLHGRICRLSISSTTTVIPNTSLKLLTTERIGSYNLVPKKLRNKF